MKSWMILCACLIVSTNVWAEDDDSYVEYDSIVSELKDSADYKPPPAIQDDMGWEEVALYGGIGFATTYVNLNMPEGVNGNGMLKGFEISGGTNLFSKKARGEFAFRNYNEDELSRLIKADLKEFEVCLVFLPILQEKTKLRMGLGLAERHLNARYRAKGQWNKYQAVTPTSILLVGFEHKVARTVMVGPDISYRTSIRDTETESAAWNFGARLSATF